MYAGFDHNSYTDTDLRDYKLKLAHCPNAKCEHARGFQVEVSREVDVAIAMRPVQLFMRYPDLDGCVLVLGNRDFTDVVQTIRKYFQNKMLYLCGWSNTIA